MKKGIFSKAISLLVFGAVALGACAMAACNKKPPEPDNEVDEHVITNCDSISANEVISLYQTNDITWVENFTDADGVTKDGCLKLSFNGNMDGDVVMLTLADSVRQKMSEGKFDYFEMTICVDNDDSYEGAYGGYTLYSANLSIPKYGVGSSLQCRKWQTVRFTLKDLFRQDVITYCYQDEPSETYDDFREFVIEKYKPGSTFFHMSDWFKGQMINLYFDSITWGSFGPDTEAPVITTDGELTAEAGLLYTIPDFKAEDEREGVVQVESVKVFKEGDATELTVREGKIVFEEAGNYTIVITAKDSAGNSAEKKFTVVVSGATADTTAPEITSNGVLVAEVGVEYTLPTFKAVDDRDGEVAIQSVKMYKEGDTTELTVVDGKYTFTEAGNYTITATAVDAAGNRGEKTVTVAVSESSGSEDPLSSNVIASYDSVGKLGVLGLTNVENGISFVESFTDIDGVTKEGLMKLAFSGNGIGDDPTVNQLVTLVISAEKLAKMSEAEFDYIEITLCVDNDDQYDGAYGGYTLYSRHKSIPPYGQDTSLRCRKWQTVRISLADLAVKGTYLNGTDSDYSISEARQAFIELYATENEFFHMSDWFSGQTIQMYIDQITWGVNGPDTTAPEISYKGLLMAEAGTEYALPTFKAVDDRDGEVAVEVKLYKEGETTELTVVDGKYTFTEAGNYTIVATAVDAAGNSAETTVTVTVVEASGSGEEADENVIATFDSAAKLGVLGLVNATDGISYAESYTDKDGVTKEGLMKLTFSGNNQAEVVTMVLSAETLAKMSAANFDYIEITLCVDNIDSYNEAYGGWSLYSFNKSIPDYNVSPLKGKKWETVRISLADLAGAGSYVSDASTLTVEEARAAFLAMYAEEANFFNLSSWFDGQTVTMYIDSITWGVNAD